jgi:hypothetical protein
MTLIRLHYIRWSSHPDLLLLEHGAQLSPPEKLQSTIVDVGGTKTWILMSFDDHQSESRCQGVRPKRGFVISSRQGKGGRVWVTPQPGKRISKWSVEVRRFLGGSTAESTTTVVLPKYTISRSTNSSSTEVAATRNEGQEKDCGIEIQLFCLLFRGMEISWCSILGWIGLELPDTDNRIHLSNINSRYHDSKVWLFIPEVDSSRFWLKSLKESHRKN